LSKGIHHVDPKFIKYGNYSIAILDSKSIYNLGYLSINKIARFGKATSF
jgi:hypothetical protein